MTDIRLLFADLAAALEDLHSLAIEGQHPDHSSDIQCTILTSVRQRMRQARRIVLDIGLELL